MKLFSQFSEQKDMVWASFLTVTLFASMMLMPDMAAAGALDGSVGAMLCALVNSITGTTGRAIATIGIIIIGIGALLGKISWGVAIIVVLGIALVFGAASLIDAMTAEGEGVVGPTGECAAGGG